MGDIGFIGQSAEVGSTVGLQQSFVLIESSGRSGSAFGLVELKEARSVPSSVGPHARLLDRSAFLLADHGMGVGSSWM